MAACSKIFGAFTCCCCTCQANHDQHVSQSQQDSNASPQVHDHAHHDHNPNRIVDDSEGANAKQFTDRRQPYASQPHGKGHKSGLDTTDDQFSDYISRAKVKIRTMTMSVRGGNKQNASNSKEDDPNKIKCEDQTKDAFSDYIKRAKIKIRKTTSIAGRKSFKESKQEKPAGG